MFSVNYVLPQGTLEYDQTYQGPGASELTTSIDKRNIDITDMRKSKREFSIDTNGFEVVRFEPAFNHFENDEAVIAQLYPSVITFLQRKFDTKHVQIFDHTYRSTTRAEKTTYNRAPVKTVHNDYTNTSAEHRMLAETKDKTQLRSRSYKLVNLWLPVHSVVKSSPLAMVDLATVQQSDFHRLKLIYPDRVGELAAISYSPKHRWYYQSDMAPGEGLLFKVFDSTLPEGMFGVPHSAVEVVNNEQGESLPPRTSIEIRAIVFSGDKNE